jgi:Tol biopolymer transport system component
VAAAGLAAAFWLWRPFGGAAAPAFDTSTMTITRLTQSGKAQMVAVSPDGRYVMYVLRDGEQQSLWVRQVATRSDVQVLPPDIVNYAGLTFSRDGDYVYFVKSDRTTFNFSSLFSMPVLGGAPRQLVRDIDAPVSFSPDGKQFAFVRGAPDTGKLRLLIANQDGSGERVLWETDAQLTFAAIVGPAWSPDGRSIAMAWGDRARIGSSTLTIVNVADGAATHLYHHPQRLGRPVWRPDGTGFFIVLWEDALGQRAQLWHIAYPSGERRRVTNDLTRYSRHHLDATADGRTLAVIEEQIESGLEVAPAGRLSEPRAWPAAGTTRGISWGPDGAIYSVAPSLQVVRMDNDGGLAAEITPEGRHTLSVSACGDGRHILTHAIGADGEPAVWRSAPDGSDAQRLVEAAASPLCSPDGTWFAFARFGEGPGRVMRMPVDGGEAVELATNLAAPIMSITPDGTALLVRVWSKSGTGPTVWQVASTSGATPRYELPAPAGAQAEVWSPDGKAIHYVLTRSGADNIWEQPLAGGPPRQITSFTTGRIFGFAWSPGGRQLALARGEQGSDVIMIGNFAAN